MFVNFPVFRVRAVMNEIEPAIWRTFEISERVPLLLVHRAMQAAFGWQDYHLHEFRAGQIVFGMIDDDAPLQVIDELPICFGQLVRREKDQVEYAYDFGDDWKITLTVEAIREGTGPDVEMRCVDGQRSGPPEDCGGAHGYGEFLEAYLVKTHPEHKRMKEWAGKRFDPEKFDAAAVNVVIERGLRPFVRKPKTRRR